MKRFDIARFALPNSPAGELRFEEARDIEAVDVVFAGSAPPSARLQTMRKVWPETRFEHPGDLDIDRPMNFGWTRLDDTFTPDWVDAAAEVSQVGKNVLRFTFTPLRQEIPEFPGAEAYDVTYRRTVGVRLLGDSAPVRLMRVYTRSQPARSRLRVELHAGKRTDAAQIEVSGYNAVVRRVTAGKGTRENGQGVLIGKDQQGSFELEIEHMLPAHRYAYDDGHLFFNLGQEAAADTVVPTEEHQAFTISLTSLETDGPIWYAEAGIYIARADDPESFEQYRGRMAGCKTINLQVSELPEQSLAGAMNGQPRPHPIAYCFGCKHARQKFWVEPTGDLQLTAWQVLRQPGRDTPRWKNEADGRFLFGLDRWALEGRHNDPWPVMAYNLQFRRDNVRVQEKCFAVPLMQSILAGEPAPDETIVALVRFRFENTGDQPALAELPLAYSARAARAVNRRAELGRGVRSQTDTLVPLCKREKIQIYRDQVIGLYQGEPVLRLVFQTDMTVDQVEDGENIASGGTEMVDGQDSRPAEQTGGDGNPPGTFSDSIRFRKLLQPGEHCELLLSIPYVAFETPEEMVALRSLDFERCYNEMRRYWRLESRKGAQIHTPDPHLNAAYAGHLPIVLMSDFGHPDGSGIVNTSVGSTTYGNYTNESVMIIEELEQRGLVEEVRRRLAVWTRYQGTVGLIGRFSDHQGVFFGADGLETGHSYNQHHGWALWYLAQHYLHTGDRQWFANVVENVVQGAEWIVRQRQDTIGELPYSRGWERGFLPAGALEDVDDFFYWLSTNCLTWRGLDCAAQALEHFGHPQAAMYRREADAYRRELVRGFETARQHSPLIRLRDGRWIPHYPSRLYCRGRDFGWIRETLEGSVYLLLSGLYDPQSKEGGWILDDFQDTRYTNPPYGYRIEDWRAQWFDCSGFSPQPNLLAGLLPHLDRDEVEIYLWMFFSAWAACYREEVQAMVEHPQPVLGFNNSAPFKTSDQSNAMKWLAYMFVYEKNGLLHLGRALPRAWFAGGERFGAERLSTPAGTISVEYHPRLKEGTIEAQVNLALRKSPGKLLLRFRHPLKKLIGSVSVNGLPHHAFDAANGDVELIPASGTIHVSVAY